MQGEVSVDDGKNWFYLLKDKKEILVGPSPRLSGEDPAAKLRNALQNYELSFGDPTRVAGRKALQIVATPKCPDMPTRKFFIDSDNHFILRVQEENKRRCKTLIDTKMVRFNVNFSDQEFSMDGQSGKIRSFSPPTHFQHSMWVKDKVGFKPAIPKELPSGFHVLDQQLAGSGANGVAVRVGDGLASATIYEWDTKSGRLPWGQLPSDAKIVQCKGIKMGLVGDIPEEAIAKLLDAFLREAMKKLQPIFLYDSSFGLQEPKAGSQTLNDQKGEFNGQQDDLSQSPAI